MLRLLPMALFGAFLGALAEVFDRRLPLAGLIGLMALTSAALSVVVWTSTLEVWQLAVASFISGCGWATDNPLRRMIMGEVVGRDRMAPAMALDVGAGNASRMVGPTLGGLLLASIGIGGAFMLSVAAVRHGHRRHRSRCVTAFRRRPSAGRRARPDLGGRGDRVPTSACARPWW